MALKLLRLLPVLALIAIPLSASAQITNGDFEAGGVGWTPEIPPGWELQFPNTGGNPEGYAQLHSPFGDSGGTACISQVFDCGVPDGKSYCTIFFDYRSESWDASPFAGRVQVFVDGALRYQSPEADLIEWTMVSISLECGPHEIKLCLNVDDGNNGWIACFDNVEARCNQSVPAVPSTWGKLKALYK